MKQALQMKMGQSLAMTPQLQQAIKLLQLSTLELQTEIQSALESNPMLEVNDDEGDAANGADAAESVEAREAKRAEEKDDSSNSESDSVAELEREPGLDDTIVTEFDAPSNNQDDIMPEDLPVDSAWEDIYETAQPTPMVGGAEGGEHRDFTEFHNADNTSIQDHLMEQVRFSNMSERDQYAAETVIDSINDKGYLTDTVESLVEGLNQDIDDESYQFDFSEVEAVLHRVHLLEPTGCGARDAQECMLIQLSQLPANETVEIAKRIVQDQLNLLAVNDYTRMRRQLKVSETELMEAIALIQKQVDPHPGRQIVNDHDEYIVPDVFVKKVKGVWRVELNPDIAPKLGINAMYAGMVKRADKSDDNNFLRNHLQEARWFIKSLQSRNETLLRVATAIVERQRSFLEYGEVAMKPLVLRDIAEQLDLHESTISRVTTQKYIHTPRGIFEFKYFFSSHVSTANGGECSATAIRAMIKKFISEEDRTKPLSDSKIASKLVADGIQVARRTVAKYRESMGIDPSNERKRLN